MMMHACRSRLAAAFASGMAAGGGVLWMAARPARRVQLASASGTVAGGGVLWMAARPARKARPTSASGTAAGGVFGPTAAVGLAGFVFVKRGGRLPVGGGGGGATSTATSTGTAQPALLGEEYSQL